MDWSRWRACRVCRAEIGRPCRSRSGRVVDGRPDGVETILDAPHHARVPRRGGAVAKSTGGKDDKAPSTGTNTSGRRDDKATSTGKPVDPKRPHTDR